MTSQVTFVVDCPAFEINDILNAGRLTLVPNDVLSKCIYNVIKYRKDIWFGLRKVKIHSTDTLIFYKFFIV